VLYFVEVLVFLYLLLRLIHWYIVRGQHKTGCEVLIIFVEPWSDGSIVQVGWAEGSC